MIAGLSQDDYSKYMPNIEDLGSIKMESNIFPSYGYASKSPRKAISKPTVI